MCFALVINVWLLVVIFLALVFTLILVLNVKFSRVLGIDPSRGVQRESGGGILTQKVKLKSKTEVEKELGSSA